MQGLFLILSVWLAGVPDAPAVPWREHRFVAPTLICSVTLPAGWSSERPMPDHILELWISADAGPLLDAMVVEEDETASGLDEAVRQLDAQVTRSGGSSEGLARLGNDLINGRTVGRVVTYAWAPIKGALVERFVAAVFVVEGKRVTAFSKRVGAPGREQLHEAEIRLVFASLACHAKGR